MLRVKSTNYRIKTELIKQKININQAVSSNRLYTLLPAFKITDKMKIIIERNQSESQTPIVTIDTKTCHYPYAIRNAIELALEIDGYSKETIREVFGIMPDLECKAKSESVTFVCSSCKHECCMDI